MPRWIELHDSTIEAVDAEATGVAIRLRTYVHDWRLVAGRWSGSGWAQPVVLHLPGTAGRPAPAVPVEISTGWARVGQATHDNLIPVPFASIERTRLWFELVTAEVFEIEGDGINIDVIGEARFIEDLPGDMMPFVVGGQLRSAARPGTDRRGR